MLLVFKFYIENFVFFVDVANHFLFGQTKTIVDGVRDMLIRNNRVGINELLAEISKFSWNLIKKELVIMGLMLIIHGVFDIVIHLKNYIL